MDEPRHRETILSPTFATRQTYEPLRVLIDVNWGYREKPVIQPASLNSAWGGSRPTNWNTQAEATWLESFYVWACEYYAAQQKQLCTELQYEAMSGSIVMDDVKSHDYLKRIAKGEIINHPLNVVSTVVQKTLPNDVLSTVEEPGNKYVRYSTLRIRMKTYVNVLVEQATTPPTVVWKPEFDISTPVNEDFTEVLGKARKRLQDADFDLLVEAAEMPETLKYLTMRTHSLGRALRDIRHGNWRKWAPRTYKRLKANPGSAAALLEDAWLEARYAIRPLLITAEQLNGWNTRKKRKSGRQTYRARDLASNVVSETMPLETGTCSRVQVTELEQRAGILAELGSEDYAKVFGLSHLVDTAIELTPFSFIAGWFVDWSNLVYELTPNINVDEKTCWGSSKVVCTDTEVLTFKGSTWVTVTKTEHKIRRPNPEVSLLKLTGIMSWQENEAKWLDIFAIGRALTRR